MPDIYGIIGFFGFECLKIYKKLWAKKDLIPKKHVIIYIISILVLAFFSGLIAKEFAHDSISEALFIGFSVPTSIKAIFDPVSSFDENGGVIVDDIDLREANLLLILKLDFTNYSVLRENGK